MGDMYGNKGERGRESNGLGGVAVAAVAAARRAHLQLVNHDVAPVRQLRPRLIVPQKTCHARGAENLLSREVRVFFERGMAVHRHSFSLFGPLIWSSGRIVYQSFLWLLSSS